jgi:hypothetical protein
MHKTMTGPRWKDYWRRRGCGFALLATLLGVPYQALAVTYEYIGAPLSSGTGSTLDGHPIILEFSTYNVLPPDLTFDRTADVAPTSNVPVINWSVSIGQYQATGVGDPAGGDVTLAPDGVFQPAPANDFYFLQFSTDSSGAITGWFFFANPVTTDRKNLIAIAVGTEFYASIVGSYKDFVQVNPNRVGTSFTDLAISTVDGQWLLVDSTPIVVPVPEPSTWAMLLLGLSTFKIAGYLSSRRTAAAA